MNIKLEKFNDISDAYNRLIFYSQEFGFDTLYCTVIVHLESPCLVIPKRHPSSDFSGEVLDIDISCDEFIEKENLGFDLFQKHIEYVIDNNLHPENIKII
jgi:hypothetical protein